MPYATLAELKSHVGIPPADVADDERLTLALDAASAEIDNYCDTTFPDPVPAPVRYATLLQAARLFKRKDAPFGVAGSVEFGSEVRLLERMDPDAVTALRPYRRSWWVIV